MQEKVYCEPNVKQRLTSTWLLSGLSASEPNSVYFVLFFCVIGGQNTVFHLHSEICEGLFYAHALLGRGFKEFDVELLGKCFSFFGTDSLLEQGSMAREV